MLKSLPRPDPGAILVVALGQSAPNPGTDAECQLLNLSRYWIVRVVSQGTPNIVPARYQP